MEEQVKCEKRHERARPRRVIGPRDIQTDGNLPKIKTDAENPLEKNPELEGQSPENVNFKVSPPEEQVAIVKEEMDIEMDCEESLIEQNCLVEKSEGEQSCENTGKLENLSEDQFQSAGLCNNHPQGCMEEISHLRKLLFEKNAEIERLKNLLEKFEQSQQAPVDVGASSFESDSVLDANLTDAIQFTPCSTNENQCHVKNQCSTSGENVNIFTTREMVDFYEISDSDLNSLLTEFRGGYNCAPCGVTFAKKIGLANHMRIHCKENPAGLTNSKTDDCSQRTCHLCQKTFTRTSALKRHTNIHQNTKFTCVFCGNAFSRRDNLNIHLKVHIGENLYRVRVSRPGQSVRHANNQTCLFCAKTFARKEHLDVHYRTHTKEKPFWCTTCFTHFSSAFRCSEHVKKCNLNLE